MKQTIREHLLPFHQMLVVGCLLASVAIGAKVAHVGSWKFTASIVPIAVAYTLLDIINERWGKRQASATIVMASATRFLTWAIFIPIALALPTIAAPEGYTNVVTSVGRVFLAGEVAILLGNLVFDIPVFAWMKEKEVWGGFFVRTNLTNIFSSLLSSFVFVFVGFYGITSIWTLWTGQIGAKLVLGVALSPFAALYVAGLRRLDGESNH